MKVWFGEYRCGCVSSYEKRKRDVLGYCGTHGDNVRHTHLVDVTPEEYEPRHKDWTVRVTPRTGAFAGLAVHTNGDGEGLFTWRADGSEQQHTGTGQTPAFRSPRQMAAWLRRHYPSYVLRVPHDQKTTPGSYD